MTSERLLSSYVGFVNRPNDCPILGKYYSNVEVVRVPLDVVKKCADKLPANAKLWIDPLADGFHYYLEKDWKDPYEWQKYIMRFEGYASLRSTASIKSPQKDDLREFVHATLDSCHKQKPQWITIPQLPWTTGGSRNKVNGLLCELASKWKKHSGFKGKLILPFILSQSALVLSKTHRRQKLEQVRKNLRNYGVDGLWVVDTTLNEQSGSSSNPQRFKALLALHVELRELIPDGFIVIAGPYWGMNLVLWARGLITHPAVGLGRAYRYWISGGFPATQTASVRIPIAPLRRSAVTGPNLRAWLKEAVGKISQKDTAYGEFSRLYKHYDAVTDEGEVRREMAKFYRSWLDVVSTTQPSGRPLALFQDLSSAYVRGQTLRVLPHEKGPARHASVVAQQLMLMCL